MFDEEGNPRKKEDLEVWKTLFIRNGDGDEEISYYVKTINN